MVPPCLQPHRDLHILCVRLDVVCYVTGYIMSHVLIQPGLHHGVFSTLTCVSPGPNTVSNVSSVCPFVLCLSRRMSRCVKGRQTER